jgi:Carboxyltransferase domain, subdomain A and B
VATACALACVVFGAPFSLSSDRQVLRPGTTFTLRAGERLHIGGTPTGMRAYFCVRGGFRGAPILGSRSALEPVRAGDELACSPATIHARFLRIDRNGEPSQTFFVDHPGRHSLRVLPGAQSDWFQGDEFFPQEFVVTPRQRAGDPRWPVHRARRGRTDHRRLSEDCPGHQYRLRPTRSTSARGSAPFCIGVSRRSRAVVSGPAKGPAGVVPPPEPRRGIPAPAGPRQFVSIGSGTPSEAQRLSTASPSASLPASCSAQ